MGCVEKRKVDMDGTDNSEVEGSDRLKDCDERKKKIIPIFDIIVTLLNHNPP